MTAGRRLQFLSIQATLRSCAGSYERREPAPVSRHASSILLPCCEKGEPAPASRHATQPLIALLESHSTVNEVNALEEPDFIITEMTLDTAATTHAADRLDFLQHQVHESEGIRAGQTFGCAGGKKLANEGEVNIVMVAPGGIESELEAMIHITKITRPLLSVTQMTKN